MIKEKSLFDTINNTAVSNEEQTEELDTIGEQVFEIIPNGMATFEKYEILFGSYVSSNYKHKDSASINEVATKAFIDYAGSVILGRSIPDLRDGLKPVQRRILHSMKTLGISHSGAHKKSARIVGDCIGKYHPHGDVAVYDTMVNMSQPWKNNNPFIDGQGNWGSIDGDSPAAMRYCLTGDSLLKLSNGSLVRLDSIANGIDCDIDLEILSVNKQVNKAVKFFNSGLHDIYTLTTKEGFSVSGSINHPVLTWTKDINGKPSVAWKFIPEITTADYIIIDRTELDNENVSSVFDLNNALIAGCLISEGSCSDKRVTFCNTDIDYFNHFVKSFTENYQGKIYTTSRVLESGKTIYEFDLQNKDNEFFKSELFNEITGKKSESKRIPTFVLNGNKDIQKLFLSYLFEGDGSISLIEEKNQINLTYTSKSNLLLKDIQILLLNFGVIAKNGKDGNIRRLSIQSFDNILNFLIKIGFATIKKSLSEDIFSLEMKRRFNEQSNGSLSKDFIPFLSDYVRANNKSTYLEKNNFDRYTNLKANLKNILNEIKNEDLKAFIVDTLNNNYYFASVESVVKEAEQKTVYSIKVDSNCHSFVCNGLINHNTEARFTKFGSFMFRDIDKDIVDTTKNYDSTETEPVVLPAPFPNILINGVPAGSIAVGMATSILPHNSTEVMNALRVVVKNRMNNVETTAEEILAVIPAPDFPTGGIVYNTGTMLDIIKNGRGSVRIRSRHHVENITKTKSAIIVTEIPFMKKKSALIDEIVNLKKNSKDDKVLAGITNIRDESTRDIRIVIEVKSGWDPEVVWSYIVKNTQFDTSVSYFSIVIDSIQKAGGIGFAPKEYGILKILERYLDFKMDLLIRKWQYIKTSTEARLHIIEGLLKALDHIDEIITIIKGSKEFETARTNLMEKFDFTEIQANSVLNIRLSKLTSMEKNTLIAEAKELEAIVVEATKILTNETYRYEIIDTDIIEVEKFIGKPRQTEIKNELNSISVEHLIPKEDCLIYVTHKGYVKRVPEKIINRQNRGTKGKKGIELTEGDFVEKMFKTHSHSVLLFVMDNGQVYGSKAFNVPDSNRGSFIKNIFELSSDELKIVNVVEAEELSDSKNLVMITASGNIKQTKLSEYTGALRKVGVNGINLKDNDYVISTEIANGTEDILIATKNAKAIKFNLSEVSQTGRSTQGVIGIRLKLNDIVIGSSLVKDNDNVVTISEHGQAKVSLASEFKSQSRAGVGVICMQTTKKSGDLSSIIAWDSNEEKDLISITEAGIVNRIDLGTIRVTDRTTKGVKLMTLNENDKIVYSIKVDHEIEETEEDLSSLVSVEEEVSSEEEE